MLPFPQLPFPLPALAMEIDRDTVHAASPARNGQSEEEDSDMPDAVTPPMPITPTSSNGENRTPIALNEGAFEENNSFNNHHLAGREMSNTNSATANHDDKFSNVNALIDDEKHENDPNDDDDDDDTSIDFGDLFDPEASPPMSSTARNDATGSSTDEESSFADPITTNDGDDHRGNNGSRKNNNSDGVSEISERDDGSRPGSGLPIVKFADERLPFPQSSSSPSLAIHTPYRQQQHQLLTPQSLVFEHDSSSDDSDSESESDADDEDTGPRSTRRSASQERQHRKHHIGSSPLPSLPPPWVRLQAWRTDPHFGLGWRTPGGGLTMAPVWRIDPPAEQDILETLLAAGAFKQNTMAARTGGIQIRPFVRHEQEDLHFWRSNKGGDMNHGGNSTDCQEDDIIRNRLYLVALTHNGSISSRQTYMLKVMLPVCPTMKTASEVATMAWAAENTDLPVPRVLSYSTSRDNAMGLEWVLMDYLGDSADGDASDDSDDDDDDDGGCVEPRDRTIRPLSECWHEVSMGAKQRIVEQLARYCARMCERPFGGGIGNLYPAPRDSRGDAILEERLRTALRCGKQARFRKGPSDEQRNNRSGPFSQTREWNLARLDIAQAQLEEQLRWMPFTPSGRRQNPLAAAAHHYSRRTTQSNTEVAQRMLRVIRRLGELQDAFWPPPAHSSSSGGRARLPAPTFLWHDNLSADNLLVDDNGVLRGVLDWADVSCLPLHAACELPALLQQRRDVDQDPAVPPSLGSRGGHLIRAYFAEKRRFETTAMRELFLATMRELSPVWMRAYEEGGLWRDMEAAIQNCDSEDAFELVERWVADIDGGKTPGKDMKWLHQTLWPL
ncbi:hypothetical protein Micbo1qcDRAFT_213371 [Microdochium bolleyi]|uniref:Aminoglycoside phosphotransferase domain-containing protein n=1 Tax=Microdochium bolleyi TaxID=196109 RepID=A0A136IW98_9PEZI|nr:hypothetical protein Micbo1qcDRAFT_213371 [Microdochium bolleyi]